MRKRPTTRSSRTKTASPADEAVIDTAQDPVRLGRLGETIAYNLRLAQNASFQAFSALTGDLGLRPGWYALLQLIGDNPGVSQTALSLATSRDKSTLTPLLGDLERRGLIRREPDPADRRGRRISLTEDGRAKLALLADCAARHDARLNALFAPGQRQQIILLLKTLTEALSTDPHRSSPAADED
ncbi:MarR family winged helix-turn-helix transcriptional regulator [Methylobacterium aquaticum]|uniref:MarR family winged helix-turn-helix transcriptional regulator n=1 Tax=Methylobacterium aquaticum TaxID=270351 RepID=UPI00193427EE|nr:MarR family transcriptional regulator [Methylobacterium aquaticum]QRE73174.1 MarR family transcriptional regulator [Methylobacterium aquaticum]